MSWWRTFLEQLRGRTDRDLEREVRSHLELEASGSVGIFVGKTSEA
jgi:hypothetical protein